MTQKEFGEWRDAVEKIISFSQASGLERALVQLALTLDTIRDIFPGLREQDQLELGGKELQIDRLLRSAMRAVRQAQTELDPTVRSIIKIYSGDYDANPIRIDRVDGWAEKGRAQRLQEGD